MKRCNDVVKHMEEWAPGRFAEEWDNVGLQVGDMGQPVRKVLICLDLKPDVIDEALAEGADMIVSHHPLLYKSVRSITNNEFKGRIIYKLIQNGICYYCAHTNLDIACGGVNDELARLLGLMEVEVLEEKPGRIGNLTEHTGLDVFALMVKKALGANHIRAIGSIDRTVKRVSVSSGSYDKTLPLALAMGADVIVSGDIRYHDALDILDAGLCAIDAGHFATENIILPVMVNYLRKAGIDAIASMINTEPYRII